MTKDERRQRADDARRLYTTMTKEQRNELVRAGLVKRIEGGSLSFRNTALVYLQSMGADTVPTIVGGYDQWKRAGRQVKRGEHGLTIWFPVGSRNENDEIEHIERFYTGTVFDISQTEPRNQQAQPEPARPEPRALVLTGPVQHSEPREAPTANPIMAGWALVS